ncbi:MAG: hypothetical protein ACR2MO_06300 [Acidimicrobiales bacterium]
MDAADSSFKKSFYANLVDQPLEPDDPRYVPFYEDPQLSADDPVESLAANIEFTPGFSARLFSGFRGSGKSTELRRLRARMRANGWIVLLVDMEDYLNLSTPLDVPDMLLAVAGAFSDQIVDDGLLPEAPGKLNYWERFVTFLRTNRVEVTEISHEVGIPGASLSVKANLKRDPTFTRLLQERMAGHLGKFVDDVHSYLKESVATLREEYPEAPGVVLIVDSMEHIRGTTANERDVQESVERVFAGHADKLRLPSLHTVYTVPPWLKVLHSNLGAVYPPSVLVLPSLKVCSRTSDEPYTAGLDALERMVRARGDWEHLLGDRVVLDRLSAHSGGHLRDLMRMLADVILRAATLPADPATVDRAVSQLRSEFLPIADADARWLARIIETHEAELGDKALLPALARFLDTHLVLCYWNGHEWYDVHPIVRDEVRRQVAELDARGQQEQAG